MRRVILVAFALSIAAITGAERPRPALPVTPPGTDYVESVCTGGVDGRYEQVRVLSNGQVQKTTRQTGGILRALATRAELLKIWRELDVARFETRTVPPENPYGMDRIDCSLTRRANGRIHTVALKYKVRDKPQYRDLTQALKDVNLLGSRAVAR